MVPRSKCYNPKEICRILDTLAVAPRVTKRRNSQSIIRMEQILKAISITQDNLKKMKVIHIAGTKGKGTVCTYCESILRSHGYRTGLYTSPHLINVRERIKLNGKCVSEQIFNRFFSLCYEPIIEEIKGPIGYFELLTAIAFKTFIQAGVCRSCDYRNRNRRRWSVVRRFLSDLVFTTDHYLKGGEYDSTNIIKNPLICGITSIGLDHVKTLGDTVEKIAWQKAGIFKPGAKCFTVKQIPSVYKVLSDRAAEKRTNLSLTIKPEILSEFGLKFKNPTESLNCALAVTITNTWRSIVSNVELPRSTFIDAVTVEGIQSSYWPGRYEVIKDIEHNCTWLLDGAHTVESARYASQWVNSILDETKCSTQKSLVVHFSHQRDPISFLNEFQLHRFDRLVFVKSTVDGHSRLDTKTIDSAVIWARNSGVSKTSVIDNINYFYDDHNHYSCEINKQNPVTEQTVVATGSLYLIGDILDLLKRRIC